MKAGDLIRFRLNFPPSVIEDWLWSDPALVIEPDDEGLWIVFMRGSRWVIDEKNYDVVHLTFS